MPIKLTDLVKEESRQAALESTQRLGDFVYPPTFTGDAAPFFGEEIVEPTEDLVPYADTEITAYEPTKENSSNAKRDYWSMITWVALVRFPELKNGEHISTKELKARLGEIKKAGYDVKPYGRMSRNELWDYNMKLRAEIRNEAKKNCPEVIEDIDESNRRAKSSRDY
jgi:hypothetical protein